MKPHAHEEDCLSILVRGAFVECIGGRERNYVRGQIAYLPAGVVHSQVFGAAGARQIIFRPQPHWLEHLVACNTPLVESPHTNSPVFSQLGDRLLGEMQADDDFSAIACEGILLEIVAAFGRDSTTSANGRPPAWLCAARDYLHQSALAPLRMQDIARVAGRHEVHVAREFRRFFGVSVGTYLRRLRTERVARLLLRPHLSISEIALECGFSSHSHLCREFKAHYGVTPSQYRRQSG
jgi:AraC family transcriptional regulator